MTSEGLVKQKGMGPVRVLVLNRAPVNALNAALMDALSAALREAQADRDVAAVVLAAEGPHFSAGSDVTELGQVRRAGLPGLCALIEGLSKPVVAAVQGNALGGAAELLLACHGRVAHEGARLGLPEISLGLLPVGGTTQRLPRLVGASVALKMLQDGVPVTAVEGLAIGLLDAVVTEAPLARAAAFAEMLASQPLVKPCDRRDGMRDPVAFHAAIVEARKRVEGWRLPAPAAAVDCVEAALLLPFDMGLGFEHSHAEMLADSPEAAGLRYAFFAEKRALFAPAELAGVAPPKLHNLMILGTAGLTADVVRQALGAGFRVRLVATDRASLGEALKSIAARQEAMVAAGQLSAAAREADWARLTGDVFGSGTDDAAAADESVDLVLAAADAPLLPAYPGPVIGLGGQGDLVLHPALASGGLAQLSISPGQPLGLQAAALALGRRLGWKVLFQGPGQALDQRLRLILSRAIAALETQGHDRHGIAAALASFGLGAGARMKLPPAPPGAGHILDFCMAAMMNEGARILSEGGARRPSDIDAAALLSGLFPRWEGGPMYLADRKGLMAVRADLRLRAGSAPQIFAPAPIFDQLINEGRSFADLNRD